MKVMVFILRGLSKYSKKIGCLLVGGLLLLILVSVFLSNEESPAFLFQIGYIVFSYVLYEILKPLHELGHYYTAKKYAERKSCVVEFRLRFGEISCSNWKVFSCEECQDILLSGSAFKILGCILIIFLLYMKKSFLLPIPLYTIAFEYISNMSTILPKTEENDISKFNDVQLFYDEDVNMEQTKTDVFIREYYGYVLMVFILGISFTNVLENMYSLCISYLFKFIAV